jgi:hypothetical protein
VQTRWNSSRLLADLVDEAEFVSFLRRDVAPSQHHTHRALHSDHTWETEDTTGTGEQADLGLRQSEASVCISAVWSRAAPLLEGP